MEIRASRCPKCKGRLTFETVGSYGDLFDVNIITGKPSERRRHRRHYEHDDCMVYCQRCGTNYEFVQKKEVIYLKCEQEETA